MTNFPYADPGRASFEDLGEFTNSNLLSGSHPELAPAVGLEAVGDALAQFSVVGYDADGKIALATAFTTAPTAAATGTLTFTGVATAEDTVTIGGVVYTFKAAPAAANEVALGADASGSAANIAAVINGTDGLSNPHAAVSASAAAGVVTVDARINGAGGNSITTTETSASASFGAATLESGDDGIQSGVQALGILAHGKLAAETRAQVWYSGCFNPEALVWDPSFNSDALKANAFEGAPQPTNILVRKRD